MMTATVQTVTGGLIASIGWRLCACHRENSIRHGGQMVDLTIVFSLRWSEFFCHNPSPLRAQDRPTTLCGATLERSGVPGSSPSHSGRRPDGTAAARPAHLGD